METDLAQIKRTLELVSCSCRRVGKRATGRNIKKDTIEVRMSMVSLIFRTEIEAEWVQQRMEEPI